MRVRRADAQQFVAEEIAFLQSCVPVTAIAWAAGLIDGEGCLFIRKANPQKSNGSVSPTYSFGLKVTMGCERTVNRVAEIFGNSGSRHIVSQGKHNDAWTWLVQAYKAVPIVCVLLPHLVTKKQEALIGLEFMALPRSLIGGKLVPPELLEQRETLFQKMRDIKPSSRFRVKIENHDE